MLQKIIFLFFLPLLIVTNVNAQKTKTKSAELSSANLNLEKKLDSIFSSLNKTNPGIAVTVLQNGKVIAKKAYGMASLEHQVPFTHQSRVRLTYSGTREFMCVGLAIMESEGLLRFNDKVRQYFPKLPAWSDDVTIQDLLNHSSGFADEWATMLLMQADMNNRVDKEQLLTFLYNQPKPEVKPGQGYMYSNSDFALLRFIMEKASGKSLPDYLQQRLFKPLAMKATLTNDRLQEIIPGLAENYNEYGPPSRQVGVKTSPGGNYRIITSADDLEKWSRALENPNSMVAKAFVLLKQNARPIPVLSPEIHYVFGHEWQKKGNVDLVKHGGVNHDFYMTRIPSLKLSIIGLGNSWGNMVKAESVASYFLPKDENKLRGPSPKLSSNPVAVDRATLSRYTGRYFEEKRNTHSSHLPNISFYDIKHSGDSLQFYEVSGQYFTLVPVGKDMFKDPDGVIIQFMQPHPDSMKFTVFIPDGTEIAFSRKNNIQTPPKEILQQYTGEYYSPHLDFYCRIVFDEQVGLVLRRATIADKKLIPNGKDRFLFEMEGAGGLFVEAVFTRNNVGEVTGIDMQHIRMMHHRFDKVK
ncbi:MAG: serine hydrolase domain-containing protein [Chitinophagaceae bacterium]